jgi:glycosyl transferase family 87
MIRTAVRPAVLAASALVVTLSIVLAASVRLLYQDPDWTPRWMIDFSVYLTAGHAVLSGQSLYGFTVVSPVFGACCPYVYPPFNAIVLFAPLALLSLGTAYLVWNILMLIVVGTAIWLTLGAVGVHRDGLRLVLTGAVLVLSMGLLPLTYNLVVGQINPLIMLLVLLDFRRPNARFKGLGVGAAAGLKVTSLIFVAYFLLTKRWTEARNAALTFLAMLAIGFAARWSDSANYWTDLLLDPSRVGGEQITANQSISGLLARLTHHTTTQAWWLPLLVAVAAFGLAMGVLAYRRGADFLGMLLVAVTMLLVSPISWEHHWMFVIPLLLWLVAWGWHSHRALPLAAAAALALVFASRWYMDFGVLPNPTVPMDLNAWQQVTASGITIAGLLVLLSFPLWQRAVPPESSWAPSIRTPDEVTANAPLDAT